MRTYLKMLRAKAGLSGTQVADAIGISHQYYSMIEAGERQRRMDVTLVAKLAQLFRVSLDDIVAEEHKWIDESESVAETAGETATEEEAE